MTAIFCPAVFLGTQRMQPASHGISGAASASVQSTTDAVDTARGKQPSPVMGITPRNREGQLQLDGLTLDILLSYHAVPKPYLFRITCRKTLLTVAKALDQNQVSTEKLLTLRDKSLRYFNDVIDARGLFIGEGGDETTEMVLSRIMKTIDKLLPKKVRSATPPQQLLGSFVPAQQVQFPAKQSQIVVVLGHDNE